MRSLKTKMIPVLNGAIGSTSKSFRKYLSSKPGNMKSRNYRKTSVLGTAHILRRVLM
jgi:hypothetical protein